MPSPCSWRKSTRGTREVFSLLRDALLARPSRQSPLVLALPSRDSLSRARPKSNRASLRFSRPLSQVIVSSCCLSAFLTCFKHKASSRTPQILSRVLFLL